MELGSFWDNAATSRPINPRKITFTAIAKGTVLPNGKPNRTGNPVAAKVTACMVFIGGDGTETARIKAREHLQTRFIDSKSKLPLSFDGVDLGVETIYQEVFLLLHQWDPEKKQAGKRLFDDIDVMRQMIEPEEAGRINREYSKYVKEEHPEAAPDAATFPKTEG